MDAEGWVLLCELGQSHAHLLLVGLRLRFHSDGDNRRGEVDSFEHNWGLFGADRVAGDKILETNRGANVASEDLGDLFALVGVHLQQTADALGLAGAWIEHGVAGFQLPRVNAYEDQLADEWVGHNLEAKRRKRLAVISLADKMLLRIVGV